MNAKEILDKFNLKNTGCRKFIIDELIRSECALSEHEIKASIPDLFDRVTFYRSLKTLEEQKIIHRVVLNNTVIKYALNNALEDKAEVDHMHFHCMKCDEVLCMEDIHQTPQLPNGFSVESAQIVLEGTCPSCKEKQ